MNGLQISRFFSNVSLPIVHSMAAQRHQACVR